MSDDRKKLPAASSDGHALVRSEQTQIVGDQVTTQPVNLTIQADGIVTPIDGAFQFISAESHYKALFARKKADAMKMIGVIHADKHHDFNDYWYASIHAINAVVKDACAHVGLALSCTPEGSLQKEALQGSKTDLWLHNFTFRLSDGETGYSEEMFLPGTAEDKGGKAFSKCMRAAQKDFYVATFMIAIDDTPPMQRQALTVENALDSCKNLINFLDEQLPAELPDALLSAGGRIDRSWAKEYKGFGFQILNTYHARLLVKKALDWFLENETLYSGIETEELKTWLESAGNDVANWFKENR